MVEEAVHVFVGGDLLPIAVKSAKLKSGDSHLAVRDEKNLFISWFDRRQVNLLTTVHNDTLFAKQVRCKDPANNNLRLVHKPMAIELYTKYMGGADMLDRQIWTYLQTHACLKWWKKLFMYLLEVTYCQFKVLVDVTSSTTALHQQTSMQSNPWSTRWLFQQFSCGKTFTGKTGETYWKTVPRPQPK